jgi:hypothetical protein
VLTRRGQWRGAKCLLLATRPHSWPSHLQRHSDLKKPSVSAEQALPHLTPTADAVLSTSNKSKIRSLLG